MTNTLINKQDAVKMSADSKIGLLATVDEHGSPHISFITSLQPFGFDGLTMGEFCEGLSKDNITKREKIGFLILTPEMEFWSGRALYSHSANSGPEFDLYNNKPLFRYNSYFGFGKIHYFNLVDIEDADKLSKGSIVAGAVKTRVLLPLASSSQNSALNQISKDMFSQIDGLKFISYLDSEGFPSLIPIIQAVNAGTDRIIFSLSSYREKLSKIKQGAEVAVFFVNLKMESVLIKGKYEVEKKAAFKYGKVDIEKVYNSMPPQPQYIYPGPRVHKKIVDF